MQKLKMQFISVQKKALKTGRSIWRRAAGWVFNVCLLSPRYDGASQKIEYWLERWFYDAEKYARWREKLLKSFSAFCRVSGFANPHFPSHKRTFRNVLRNFPRVLVPIGKYIEAVSFYADFAEENEDVEACVCADVFLMWENYCTLFIRFNGFSFWKDIFYSDKYGFFLL